MKAADEDRPEDEELLARCLARLEELRARNERRNAADGIPFRRVKDYLIDDLRLRLKLREFEEGCQGRRDQRQAAAGTERAFTHPHSGD